ncbi:hypothetical protein TNCT_367361 [Trichonephila clavata]|uniref:Uncharacterized protein n=1 Tax=Trichonephila clavata TaxID=2740835 RepID=A0A8X6F945_TRICU|nr:hypothetical protein TNCT_367361 [Trichonephila clavata]
MRTGHYYLATHLHRINVLPSPECQPCGYGTMNAEHLRNFSALDHSKNRSKQHFQGGHLSWSARNLIDQQPLGWAG